MEGLGLALNPAPSTLNINPKYWTLNPPRAKVEGLGELRKKLKAVQKQTAALKDNGSKVWPCQTGQTGVRLDQKPGRNAG